MSSLDNAQLVWSFASTTPLYCCASLCPTLNGLALSGPSPPRGGGGVGPFKNSQLVAVKNPSPPPLLTQMSESDEQAKQTDSLSLRQWFASLKLLFSRSRLFCLVQGEGHFWKPKSLFPFFHSLSLYDGLTKLRDDNGVQITVGSAATATLRRL